MNTARYAFAALITACVASHASSGVVTTAQDQVWSDGTNFMIWGPGVWTRDDQELGRTFFKGEVQMNGAEHHNTDSVTLDQTPDGFHFDVQVIRPADADRGVGFLTIDVWMGWPLDMASALGIVFPAFDLGVDITGVTVMIDLGTDSAIVYDTETHDEFYNGSADPFIGGAELPVNFTPAYATRTITVPAPGTLALMLLGELTILNKRRR